MHGRVQLAYERLQASQTPLPYWTVMHLVNVAPLCTSGLRTNTKTWIEDTDHADWVLRKQPMEGKEEWGAVVAARHVLHAQCNNCSPPNIKDLAKKCRFWEMPSCSQKFQGMFLTEWTAVYLPAMLYCRAKKIGFPTFIFKLRKSAGKDHCDRGPPPHHCKKQIIVRWKYTALAWLW